MLFAHSSTHPHRSRTARLLDDPEPTLADCSNYVGPQTKHDASRMASSPQLQSQQIWAGFTAHTHTHRNRSTVEPALTMRPSPTNPSGPSAHTYARSLALSLSLCLLLALTSRLVLGTSRPIAILPVLAVASKHPCPSLPSKGDSNQTFICAGTAVGGFACKQTPTSFVALADNVDILPAS